MIVAMKNCIVNCYHEPCHIIYCPLNIISTKRLFQRKSKGVNICNKFGPLLKRKGQGEMKLSRVFGLHYLIGFDQRIIDDIAPDIREDEGTSHEKMKYCDLQFANCKWEAEDVEAER